MNFCTKCGAKLAPGSNFCTACGASISARDAKPEPAAQIAEEPAPHFTEEPAPQPSPAPHFTEEPAPQPSPAPQPQYTYGQSQYAVPKPPRRKNPKLKLFVILGACAAALIAGLLVFFLAIFPEITATHINMGDYVKVKFDDDNYTNGYIRGKVVLDLDKAYEEIVTDKTEISEFDFKSYFRDFEYEFDKKSSGDTVSADVNFTAKDKNISKLEKSIGVRFDDDAKAEVNISDELKKNKITVVEPINLDVFEILDECYYTTGVSKSDIIVNFDDDTIFKEGYEFEVSGFSGEYSSKLGYIYISKGAHNVGSMTFESDKSQGDKGEKLTLTVTYKGDERNKKLMKGTPFIISKTEKEYTINPIKGIDLKQAKSYLGKVRQKVRAIYTTNLFKLVMGESYLLTAKNKDSDDVNKVITLVSKVDKKHPKYSYYVADIRENCYIDSHAKSSGDKFCYEDYDTEFNYKSKADLWRKLKKKYGSDFKIQKIS